MDEEEALGRNAGKKAVRQKGGPLSKVPSFCINRYMTLLFHGGARLYPAETCWLLLLLLLFVVVHPHRQQQAVLPTCLNYPR